MPSTLAEAGALDIVLGDRFGASAAPWVVEALESALLARGYRVRRNKPYAGGFITEHYGLPAAGRHAVQIEVNRALYMDEARMVKHGTRGRAGRIVEGRRGGAGGPRAGRTGGRTLGGGMKGRSARVGMRGPHKGGRTKKEAAMSPRRPESREETPKEGICGRSCRTATICACDATKASLSGTVACFQLVRRFCNTRLEAAKRGVSIISYDTRACAGALRQGATHKLWA